MAGEFGILQLDTNRAVPRAVEVCFEHLELSATSRIPKVVDMGP